MCSTGYNLEAACKRDTYNSATRPSARALPTSKIFENYNLQRETEAEGKTTLLLLSYAKSVNEFEWKDHNYDCQLYDPIRA